MDSRQWREFLDTAIGEPPGEVTVHAVRRRMMRRRLTEAAAAAVVLVAVGVTVGTAVLGSAGPGGNQGLTGPAVHVKVEAPPKVYVDYVPEQKHPRNIYLPINPATNRAGKPIHLPCAINCLFEAAPNGKTLYIAAGDSVIPLDTRTDKPGTPIKVGKDGAENIKIDPNGKVAYVTGNSRMITPIDLTTNTAGKPFKLVTEGGVFAFSADGKTWGAPALTGTIRNTSGWTTLKLTQPVDARYFKFRALSEWHGGPWTSAAELDVQRALGPIP